MKKKRNLLSVLILMLLAIFSACSSSGNPPVVTTPTPGAPIYKVIHETGLYASLTSTDPTDILPVGTLLKPADNAKYYDCKDTVDSGETLTLCHIEVVNSGKTGWVLQNWIARE